ncbi:molybdopterin-dependent oxidoreductase [Metabacillus litoralis]|uniref:molybdopterin-dependent oxidoreductase n=1 Tax=Metabacillus litoralis TaxID=152268 RepID=UPI001CFC77C1|nr:molybdopterin-dependent oxidoreductase [Metabacillus litoralis]
MNTNSEVEIHYRTCPLCEATCGLEIHTKQKKVVSIRGDKLDPFSEGYLCPKGFSLKELHEDPDRIRKPIIRKGTEWKEVSWNEAFLEVRKGLQNVIKQYGQDGIGVYLGNPNVHNLAGLLYAPIFLKTLRTRYKFSASTMDQIPKQLTAEMMYGNDFSIPIPDIDRTDYFLILGANPLVSNGSLMTAPNMKKRLSLLQDRGGKVVVIDPVKTLTAKAANEHYPITPGTDAYLLLGMIHTLFDENLIKLRKLSEYVNGLDKIEKISKDFSPELVEDKCSISAETIRKLARELSHADSAAVYGRMGTSTQEFGTITSWLIELLNILTGNLDHEGGVLFTTPAAGGRNIRKTPRKQETYRYERFHSPITGLAEVLGELPVSSMCDEIEQSNELKAFITIAGNPCLSAPNSKRLQKSFEKLEFIVSIDCYLNETTKHANVILPIPSPLERSHYDLSFYHLSVRNIAHYSKPIFDLPMEQLDEWEILLHLTEIVSAKNFGEDSIKRLDDLSIRSMVKAEVANISSPIYQEKMDRILEDLNRYQGPERMLDFLIRVGPYGDHFGKEADGLTLAKLKTNEHGLDLGPLKPRIPEVLLTSTAKIELAPRPLIKDIERLTSKLSENQQELVLIGRRDLRSNNSWMHNLPVLVKGKNRCTLFIHPNNAIKQQVNKGDFVKISSRVGSIVVSIEITDEIKEGVVSLPHGWGHLENETQLQIAKKHAGVSSNILTDELVVDQVSGNAVLNGIPVTIEKINIEEGEENKWQYMH